MTSSSMAFADPANILGLTEHSCLASAELETRSRFIMFPEETEDCIPKQFPLLTQSLPRFSFFEADEVHLSGNRLFSVSGMNFTDASLTAEDLDKFAQYFNKKMSLGNRENISLAGANAGSEVEVGNVGRVLLPCSDEPSNFGSWIFRFLPKLALAKEHASFDAIFVYQPAWITELLRLVGIDCKLIEHDPTKRFVIRQAVIPSLPVPQSYFRSEVLECFSRLHHRQDASVSLGDRLYVSRRAAALKHPLSRALENETGLVAMLQTLGFVEFIPERYTIAQQVSIFDKAKIIVGCGGSNMFGCVFARSAELIVDIESGNDWAHAHANLLASTGANWTMIRGRRVPRGTSPHLNWTVDIDAVGRGLSRLLL